MPDPTPAATIVITTKNRKDELRAAIASTLTQTVPVEVLVMDDGSTDGTSEMIRAEFPGVKVHRFEPSQGYIVQRNRAATLATTPFIFSLDDDATFPSARTVEQTLREFDHPRVGAVAIPMINVMHDDKVWQLAPDERDIYTNGFFWGTAHALRRNLFLQLGGYREVLFHQGEEADFCIRMLAAGYISRLGLADPIHHFDSPKRDRPRMYIYGARNTILYAWHNVPLSRLPVQWIGSVVQYLRYGFRRRHPIWVAIGLIRGFGISIKEFRHRRPISVEVYKISRLLRKDGAVPLGRMEPLLPPQAPLASS